MEILHQLSRLGLKEKAAKAYLALIKLQKANPSQIAKEAGIERTTAYVIMEDLAEKGLAAQSIEGKKIIYTAEPPKTFETILNKQQNILQEILPMLQALSGNKNTKPIIKYHESIEGIKQALMESLECEEKLRRDFASVDDIAELLGAQFLNRQIKNRVAKKIWVKSLRASPKGNKISEKDWFLKSSNKELLREVCYLKNAPTFSSDIFVYDSTVLIISSKKEHFALSIESIELSQAMKILFDIAWENSK